MEHFNEKQFVDLRDERQGRNSPKLSQKPSISNTQREVLRIIPRGQDETREDNDWENNNGNHHTLVPGGLHPLVPQQTVHDPESDVPKPVNDPRHGTQHDWDENHCENSECTFPRGHPGMCSHHLVGNDADGPPANRLNGVSCIIIKNLRYHNASLLS